MNASAWTGQLLIWAGIIVCISQASILSGLNLAIFSISRLRLEVEAAGGNHDAISLLGLRSDANFTLATVLWANVAVNVLLTLLSSSVLAGVAAFLFSTVVITLFGEIAPQAYFARHALKISARFRPLLSLYRILVYPVARPTALLLDRWIGKEAITLFRERDFRALFMKHTETVQGDVGFLEATGAMNFLDLDDIPVVEEGELLDPRSVVTLPLGKDGRPALPAFDSSPDDPFLRRINASGMKWVVITDLDGRPSMVMDAHHFLRHALFDITEVRLESYWHRPLIVTDMHARIGDVIGRMKVTPEHPEDDVIDHDLILVWGKQQKRIITGADLLGRLLRGIANRER